MSNAAPEHAPAADDPGAIWRDRIKAAKDDRRRQEPVWLSNLAFASGKHYLMFDRFSRTMMLPQSLQKDMEQGNLYTSDVITERRMRALGELSGDDDRPELLLVDDDDANEDFQAQLNRAVGFGWDYEWRGDEALLDLRQKIIDLGTAAVRCRFDPTVGKPKDEVPHVGGKPVLDPEQARQLMANGPRSDVTVAPIREGRITWDVLSSFNLLVPPGVEHEKDFPWEIVVRPVPLDEVKALYPAAATLTEDGDIGNVMGLSTQADSQGRASDETGASSSSVSRLRDHVWVYTCYQRPNRKHPDGQVVVLAGTQMKFMEQTPELPYLAPDGTRRSGIAYFHWWRTTGRFWSRALIETMKDPQRRVNKLTNQIDKTIDRGQPFVMVDKNSKASKRKGFPVEVIELEASERQPVVSSGIPVGAWMFQAIDTVIEDLDRASGIGQSALGENPENAQTYGQLALLHEQEAGKRTVIRKEHSLAVQRLVEDSVYDIRTYWGPDKQILLDAEDDRVQAEVFNATRIPSFYIVRAAKGSPKPRSQGAELQKINDIYNAAVEAQAVMANPGVWVKWFKESLDAGQPLELPEQPNDEQDEKAKYENRLLAAGTPCEVAYYDSPQIHIPVHREGQIEAEMAGDMQAVAAFEQHIQQHMQMAQQVAEQQAQAEAPAQVQGEMEQQQNMQQQAQQDHQRQVELKQTPTPPSPAAPPAKSSGS